MFCYHVFVCILPGKAILKMTYTVSGGVLNPTQLFSIVCVQMIGGLLA